MKGSVDAIWPQPMRARRSTSGRVAKRRGSPLAASAPCPVRLRPRDYDAAAGAWGVLLPLPACHKGVYARLRRAMERVWGRGPLHKDRLAEGEGAGEKPPSDRGNKIQPFLNL